MSGMNRRDFLKVASVTGAAVLGSPALRPITAFSKEELARGPYDGGTWIPSLCKMCGGNTGILCQVVEGRLVRIKPNHHNPIGFSNISTDFFVNAPKEGAVICPKGNAGIMALYDPDRLKRPLRRTNSEKGIGVDPRWKEISWDEALAEIAGRLKALRDGGEAHKLIWITEDASFVDMQQDFCRLFGTPNFGMHSNLCDTGRKASFKMVVGDERPLMDALQSKYMLVFGWNPVSATKWSHLPRIITRGIEHGARLVVVDPNLSYTASKAHEWVPIRPGTDGALALAMGHVILRDGLYDRVFVERWTTGFDEYAAYVEDKTPQWANAITTIPSSRIERLAQEFATTKPATLDVWSGAHHSNGVNAGRAIACLAALVGSFDVPGGLILPERKGPKYQPAEAPDLPSLKQPRLDGSGTKYPYKHASGVYCEWVERTAKGDGPYQPKILVSIFQNPMMAVIGTKTAEAALRRFEFIVQIDTMLSETAEFADIVLPGTTYFERYDLDAPWVTWPSVTLRQPVVKPLFGQPAEYEAIVLLGRKLDLHTKEGKAFFFEGPDSGRPVESPTQWYEEYLSRELKAGGPKIGLPELKALPGAVWVDTIGTRYQKYTDAIPNDVIARSVKGGNLLFDEPKGEGGQPVGIFVDGKWVKGFNTSTRKIELASASWASKKDANGRPIPALPIYEPRDWQPNTEWPLFLINWKEASQTHSRTQNNAFLAELKATDGLRINMKTAARLRIRQGDWVWVESPYGKLKMKAELTEGIHPEVVGTQHGWGHWAMGRIAKGRGAHTGFLAQTKADPISGQSLNKEICVRVYKA